MTTCGLVILEIQGPTLLPASMWKVENIPNFLGDLAEEVSGQGVASVTWLLLLNIIKYERTGIRKGRTFNKNKS